MKKKRRKFTRMRGSHTHGTGGKKRKRGKGHRGGKGMAGTGKRADQKKTKILKRGKKKERYFGKYGFKSKKKKLKIVNVGDLENLAKNTKELNLKNYKILSNGEIKSKLIISAAAASGAAIEKIKAAGGEVRLIKKKIKVKDKKPKEIKKDRGYKTQKSEKGEIINKNKIEMVGKLKEEKDGP